jgi:uncharacterized protein (UPF0276 family)
VSARAGFPSVGRGLGVGLDLPWGAPVGFATDEAGREGPSARLAAFLRGDGARFAHVFVSWQPRDRGRLRLEDYAPAWDALAAALPPGTPLALHHTALDLAAPDGGDVDDRSELFAFTNALCARYHIAWINEDVGFWSLGGRPLPYPLPPLLDAEGLAACVRNVRACQRALAAPLVLEFPGFSDGVSVVHGDLDAYDFFRALAEETGAPVTLDVGHLLSWRWWRGARGEALFGDLDRLPLDACFEVHLSGCQIACGRFVDAHHGALLDEQLVLLGRLLPLCPQLRAVTFEDPRLEVSGALEPASARSLARLERLVAPWVAAGAPPPVDTAPPSFPAAPLPAVADPREQTLASLIFDREARAAWRRAPEAGRPLAGIDPGALEDAARAARAMLRTRSHRGTGRLPELFSRSLAGWRQLHPEDADLDELVARFLASPAAARWREAATGPAGDCVEACFAAFLVAERIADPATVEDELYGAVLRTLTVTPEPRFRLPVGVRRAPGGWFAITAGDASAPTPTLHAALDGRYVTGPVTPLVATLVGGVPVTAAARHYRVAPVAAAAVHRRLLDLRLV